MTKKLHLVLVVVLMGLTPLITSAQVYWANDVGGIFNIPPVEYNEEFHGYGSFNNVIYNKIDLQTGKSMFIENPDNNETKVPLYNGLGELVDYAWNSPIGRDHGNIDPEDGYVVRDGGIIAGSIAQVKVGNTTYTMVYAWSVNTQSSGRRSGWIRLDHVTPNYSKDGIRDILEQTKAKRMSFIELGGITNTRYDEYEIIIASLPSYADEYYVVPGRSASKTAGKARFYYSVDEPDGYYISGMKNIVETGLQRFGVAVNNLPIGAKFYRDMGEPVVERNIYPASSETADSHKLKFVWGYSVTSAGEKIYSFINERTLKATGKTDVEGSEDNDNSGDGNIVHITKRNAPTFAIDGNNGASNNQNVRLFSANKDNVNQQWIEIDRGNGYYSYQKANTNHCMDGGDGGSPRQNVLLWPCSSGSQNQQWKKQATSGGAFKLIKRNSQNYTIDGGSGGSNNQNVQLYTNVNHQNLEWFITPINGGSTTPVSGNIAPIGNASQSSTAFGGSASRAIDGNTSGDWSDGSITHTNITSRPHWQVEWNDVYEIDEIKIFNRTNCCSDRLSDFTVWVIDDNTGNQTFREEYSGLSGSSLTINTGGVKGNRVKIRLNGTNYLSLAEVQVFGSRASNAVNLTTNLAFNAPEETTVFPNPATSLVNISYSEDKVLSSVNIYDFSGRMVESRSISSGSNQGNLLSINTEHLFPGLYTVQVNHVDGTIESHKLLIN